MLQPQDAVARRSASSTVPSLVILWMLLILLFLCTISSGGATQTHDHTTDNNSNKNQQDESIGAAATRTTTTTFSSSGTTEHNVINNDSYSLGYQYMEDGIQSSSVGNLADALSSFRKAVAAYQLHLDYDQDDAVAKDQLADALYRLAETSSSMPAVDINQSQPYYEQALDLYAKLPGKSAKLRWAHCLARLGVLMIDQHSTHLPKQVQDLIMQQQSRLHGDDWNDEEAMEQVMSKIDVNIPNQAIQYFQDAANVFRSSLEVEGSRQMLATSLQNMAVAMTHAGRVNDAIVTLEESIGIYEAMVATGLDDDSAQGMAEAFYSLSDLYLQNSNFEMAKDRYRRSMDCYENFQLPPMQTPEDDELGDFDWSDQVAELENALEEYMNLDADDMSIYGEEAEFFGDDGYNLKDPGYEGDLHTNLGSLYLAQGDMVLAASHLQQAVRKYELLGEANTHNMATAKYNLAMLYFKSSEFSKSAVFQAEAIDVFRAVGAEFSPIHVEAIEDQIQEAVLSQVKHTEGDNDEPIIDYDDSNMDQSKSSDVAAKDGHATIGKDEVSGLIVDVEHFLLKNANFSVSDEL